ncbi:proline iminopeptidase, partial [Thozetella sp. PMI_491]
MTTEAGYQHEAPFDNGFLQVDAIHELYYEQYGSIHGLPVVFVHGGPGGETSRGNTKFFNPAIYRVVLFDQRGAGKSRPRNELRDNTTQHLVEDIERIREHLGIHEWHMVFGGSWGTTLSLAYTQTHPSRVGSLVLRGVLTVRKSELAHSRRAAAAMFFPDVYEKFLGHLPESEREDPIKAYYSRLTSDNIETATDAAREWNRWAMSIECLVPESFDETEDPEGSLTHALLEAHYFVNGAWLDEGQLLAPENVEKMKNIRGAIIQGRYDLLTPPQTAWDLHKAWPKSSLYWISDAGHSASEPGITAKLIDICDEFARA